jgi:hypothetical protein
MEQIVKDHFGNNNIYRFNGNRDRLSELGIPVNYIIVQNEIYFVSEETSNDVRVELMYAKEPE